MKILVAEDEQRIATLLADGLAERGFEVQKVHRGDDALDLASRDFFDALVLDVNMPGVDGFQVVQQLRKQSVRRPHCLVYRLLSHDHTHWQRVDKHPQRPVARPVQERGARQGQFADRTATRR